MTIRDSVLAGLVFAVKREKDLEVDLGDSHDASEAMSGELTSLDPAAHRANGDVEHFGDVRDCVEFCSCAGCSTRLAGALTKFAGSRGLLDHGDVLQTRLGAVVTST